MFKAGIPTIEIMKISSHQTEREFLKYILIDEEETAERLSVRPNSNQPVERITEWQNKNCPSLGITNVRLYLCTNHTCHASHQNSAPGQVFDFIGALVLFELSSQMKFRKIPVNIKDQITLLKSRGLVFHDEALAQAFLSAVSYYRLRAYTYPFQDNANPDHPFIKPVSFEEIIDLYKFDDKLRTSLLDEFGGQQLRFTVQDISKP
jgi:hypothetical protein